MKSAILAALWFEKTFILLKNSFIKDIDICDILYRYNV